ncbi:class B sortase [Gemella sp. GH3]|uniref:class B sortase, LPKTxAVK-specific n=1 Tax=unclassified Gemella TaxID=2624949 RepID=UPI0015CFEC01|nr:MULTISPECIES: class B sortase, LPKTxAVK-specific [unclassified Gemella]MBF0713516.1 class B sortase [Gemella sp. GH3.1]NYS50468.1 class B sortase [Gemella sp. GH3]
MNLLKINFKRFFSLVIVLFLAIGITFTLSGCSSSDNSSNNKSESSYKVSEEEKTYLKDKFDNLSSINKDTISYVYAPGTNLDEPIVQTTDNETYLDKTFEGAIEPLMGTVYMDMDNNKTFNDKLTWLFGHARGSKVPDSRMFNDVNFYDKQSYFDAHPYVVIETPERKYYYEAAFLIIVPETTAFYRTSFDSDSDFAQQLSDVSKDATTKSNNIKIDANDKYLVLSTCREEDETIRSNLYLRQIPDKELSEFLEKNKDKLKYEKTR